MTGKPDNSPRSATSDAAIHLSPAGRQHVGMGEVATLDAINDAKKHYAIDDNRIVIGGASWGGTGGFHFATFLPERFAAYLLPDNQGNLPFLLWDTPGDGHYQASHAYRTLLRRAGFRQSMSNAANCYDNAFMESCFGRI